MLVFEFFLSIRVLFGWSGLATCLAGLLRHSPFFRKRQRQAQLPFLSSWRRRSGGRAWSDRYMSRLIGVKSFAEKKIPIDSSGLIFRIKCGIVRYCGRCLRAFNGTHIQWVRRKWRRDRWLRWLGAILFVCSNHGHSSQHIEWVGRQVEIIEAGWQNWMLTAKPIWNCGFIGYRIDCDNLWLQRSDGGDSNCLPCHCSW